MPKKRFSAEQIVMLLRQIEVSMAQGNSTPVACRDAGIADAHWMGWHVRKVPLTTTSRRTKLSIIKCQ
jgi:hypothetical protein